MTNKADLEKVQFHNYNKHSRLNNPTLYLLHHLVSLILSTIHSHSSHPIHQSNNHLIQSQINSQKNRIQVQF